MSDQGQGQSEQPSIREQIRGVLSPSEPEQSVEPPEVPADTAEETPQTPETPEGAEEADPTENWEEVEVNGHRITVPPEVAKEVTKGVMQERDYTQKTQEIADMRRVITAEKEGLELQKQAYQALQPIFARGQEVDRQLQELSKVDWNSLEQNDPLQYATKSSNYARLVSERQQLMSQAQQGKAYIEQQTQAALFKAAQAAAPILKKSIPDWGPEKDAAITKFAIQSLGAPAEDLRGLATKPWAVVALEKARKYDELQASKAQLPKKGTLSPVAKPGAKPTVDSSKQASYRKALEQMKAGKGKDREATRSAIRALLGKP